MIRKVIILSLFFWATLSARNINAQVLSDTDDMYINTGVAASAAGINVGVTAGEVIATVIEAFLGFLGIILIVLIIIAGFNYMTANGEDEKVNKAKKTLLRAVIGLIIIVAAYSLTYFVFNALEDVAGNGNGPANGNPVGHPI